MDIEVAIESRGSEATIEPQIPIRFHFSFTGLPREAATVVLTVAGGYSLGRGFGRRSDEWLTFRSIPVEGAR